MEGREEKRGRKRKSRREEREESGSRGRRQRQNFTMTIILCFQVMNKHRYSHTMYELLLSRLIHVSYMSTNIHFLFTRMEVFIRDKGNLKVLKDSRGELVSEYQLPQYLNFPKQCQLSKYQLCKKNLICQDFASSATSIAACFRFEDIY